MKFFKRAPLILAVTIYLSIASSSFAATACFNAQSAYFSEFGKELEATIVLSGKNIESSPRQGFSKNGHAFTTNRGAYIYLNLFGRHLLDRLKALGKEDVIIDAGVGDAFFADSFLQSMSQAKKSGAGSTGLYKEYINHIAETSVKDRPLFWGIGYELVTRSLADLKGFIKTGRFKISLGQFFESISPSVLTSKGKIKVIFDFYGVLAYSERIDFVLKKYLEILDQDGAIYASNSNVSIEGVGRLKDYLKTISGIKVTEVFEEFGSYPKGFIVERTGDMVRIPEVKLLESPNLDRPPWRRYFATGNFLEINN